MNNNNNNKSKHTKSGTKRPAIARAAEAMRKSSWIASPSPNLTPNLNRSPSYGGASFDLEPKWH